MRIHEILNESPIGNFDVMGSMDGTGSFKHADDHRLLSSKKAISKVRRIFEKVPQVFDLCFLDANFDVSDIIDHVERYSGVYARGEAEQKLDVKLPASSTPDATMVVFTNNEGGNRLPMTGWIIAHRIGHALTSYNEYLNAFEDTVEDVKDITGNLYDNFGVPKIDTIYAIGKMASCRNRSLNSSVEFPIECFAQFLLTGKVSLKRFAQPMVIHTDNGPKTISDERYMHDTNDTIANSERAMNRRFARMVFELAGKVVVL